MLPNSKNNSLITDIDLTPDQVTFNIEYGPPVCPKHPNKAGALWSKKKKDGNQNQQQSGEGDAQNQGQSDPNGGN